MEALDEAVRPVRELKDFQKLSLRSGQKETVTFVLPKANMGFYDDTGRYLLEDGEFQLCAGGSWQCRMLADEAADIIISGSTAQNRLK